MARSQDDTIGGSEMTFNREDLPEGEARLVIREQAVTTIVQGEASVVERRFTERLADELNTTVENLARVEEYPMPDPLDDEPIRE